MTSHISARHNEMSERVSRLAGSFVVALKYAFGCRKVGNDRTGHPRLCDQHLIDKELCS